ncbi:MAG: putative colanic acid biosynthesis acetyltransferase [Dysgonamonadaceae bacterium]|jgi:putative colanic acid biosynthesis acetyltransferase WcaF|nr:putative colanic acid biosynthesis acetyltransferase [Dysgonamonadaceae bacterium]
MPQIDLSQYKNTLSRKNQLLRLLWTIIWSLFARPLPRNLWSGWKRFLLRAFGAKIHPTANIYSSARIYAPWNLEMHEYSCLASEVDCYNVAPVIVGAHATVSQKAYLCTSSHDITDKTNPLITAPIIIEDQAWIAADAFIGMGVTIGQGAVVGARAAVFKDVEPWTVVGGNPAKFIKNRIINS